MLVSGNLPQHLPYLPVPSQRRGHPFGNRRLAAGQFGCGDAVRSLGYFEMMIFEVMQFQSLSDLTKI